MLLNTLFIALVIFYVYPLRFMMLFLTNLFFGTGINIHISGEQVPFLLVYYGLVAFALYFLLFLFYQRVSGLKEKLELSQVELMYTQYQKIRLVIMFAVPLISIGLTLLINQFSFIWASIVGGNIYWLYYPSMMIWSKKYKKRINQYNLEAV